MKEATGPRKLSACGSVLGALLSSPGLVWQKRAEREVNEEQAGRGESGVGGDVENLKRNIG